jgi:hypothetical protein
MNEIGQMLQQRLGLSEQQAQEVENAVIDIVKSKVPAEFQGIVGSVLGSGGDASQGQTAPSGGLGGLLSTAEGLFENKG